MVLVKVTGTAEVLQRIQTVQELLAKAEKELRHIKGGGLEIIIADENATEEVTAEKNKRFVRREVIVEREG